MLKKKNTLLTGVVFPLMSLAIAVEPAAAGFAGAARAQAQVSQTLPGQVILAQAEPAQENPEEELRKKRHQAEEAQPQAEPKREERAPEPQREPEPKREAAPAEPRPEPKHEAPPEPQQREARPEPAPAPAEQPQERPRKPERAQEPQGEGEQRPARQREAAPEAAPAEQQPQERPRKPQKAEQPAGEGEQRPERPRKEKEPAKEPAAEQQPAARPENAEQPAKPREPAPAKKPQVEEKAPEQKAEPVEKPVPEKKPAAPEPAVKEAPVPTEAPTPARPPAPEAQPNPAPGRQPSEQPPVEGQGGTRPAAPLPGAPTPPPSGATTGQAPAGEPVPNQVAVPQTEAPPTTKEELDKAKAIAKDPSKTADTVILPVDKGAAVLDSDKEVERSGNRQTREERRREREQAGDVKVPTSDAEAQRAGAAEGKAPPPPVKLEAITSQQGERIDRRPQYERPDGVREWQPREGRPRDRDRDGDAPIILQFGDRVVVRGDDNQRFIRDGGEPYYERLPGGRVRETVERRDGTQVVTIRNRYGDVIQRSRIDDRGREYVLFYAPELMDDPDRDYVYRDPGLDLPPMRLRIPVTDYIIDTSSDPDRDYYRFLEQPPVEPVERVYSLDEVRYSARIRDKVRRIDLDTITFATGSAEIPMAQARSLRKVADAINKALQKNPAETFLIEGHTDAVGSDESNLVLSDERAASVANVLTDVYGIPPENLATQGYGERYLKVQTLGPEQQNRRVTIRRVTPLVKPIAQN
ncbi:MULTISPECIES: OmpA family protein [Agrobacterium]|uniref:Cell envelope biogenesis protein OmpA n=1 Tax=Agrobacterium tumefaciens TaxID=358 RepID=A0AAE6BAT6_AGRTU|nr:MULTISPECIES: OmpA family protein [Agrobacterium]QCL73470.1 cell envelope biogenesis protein OmpA [Agrobacterium tumefaciens]QCL79042.1 cell envelope biogenesis protein OmpA [Agrobacterium tumefaciens]CUX41599.1 OmpA family protein [Agrobacterium sp. NCPPB 925]